MAERISNNFIRTEISGQQREAGLPLITFITARFPMQHYDEQHWDVGTMFCVTRAVLRPSARVPPQRSGCAFPPAGGQAQVGGPALASGRYRGPDSADSSAAVGGATAMRLGGSPRAVLHSKPAEQQETPGTELALAGGPASELSTSLHSHR
jgi:hypothetical protein